METIDNRTFELIQHPRSGETYVCELIDGTIKRAAGPIYYEDEPQTPDAIQDWLDNQDEGDNLDDGAGLEAELWRAAGN